MHLWKENEKGEWKGSVATMGHLDEIVDMCLISDFGGLMTVGKDQTCRIYSFILDHFCEISRPQVNYLIKYHLIDLSRYMDMTSMVFPIFQINNSQCMQVVQKKKS